MKFYFSFERKKNSLNLRFSKNIFFLIFHFFYESNSVLLKKLSNFSKNKKIKFMEILYAKKKELYPKLSVYILLYFSHF